MGYPLRRPAAFREAVRLTHTLWGGRFNPIVMVDRGDEARQTIELFRVDIIVPVGAAEEVQNFPAQFPYLLYQRSVGPAYPSLSYCFDYTQVKVDLHGPNQVVDSVNY